MLITPQPPAPQTDHRLIVNRMPLERCLTTTPDLLLDREWLVTNGLGGYASGSVAGVSTRRYHGLLVAALAAPLGRTVMLNHLLEELRLPGGSVVPLGGDERAKEGLVVHGATSLEEFRLESGLPVWAYAVGGFLIEKRLLLLYRQNTVHVTYRMLAGPGSVRLRLRPSVHFRPHEQPVSAHVEKSFTVVSAREGFEIHYPQFPPLRTRLIGPKSAMVLDGGHWRELYYRLEHERGYDSKGKVWSPGYFRSDLAPGQDATLVASTESWDVVSAIDSSEAAAAEQTRRTRLLDQACTNPDDSFAAELVLAADQFVITPATRVADAARSQAAGDEARSVIAGYHWFTDWGRDTMISLEGLSLLTGRHEEAGYILRSFAHHIRDGLIPNLFPEGGREGLYHTADATLWYFHALDRYLQATGDRITLRLLLPLLRNVIDHHRQGTSFGIRVDPDDGLLSQGQAGYQLTWMDAKVGDWVVTPRRGKAVEINALWYNALRLTHQWVLEEETPDAAEPYAEASDQVYHSFNARFWFEQGGYLYDVVDGEAGNDASFRPNQIFAISLDHPVLERARWHGVLQQIINRLLTPMGLRSLAPGEPGYKAQYYGDLRARDAAYHQGTVWAWLVGPMVDAWLKVHPHDRATARGFLDGFRAHVGEACFGSISEVFDAEAPYTPRGCVAQAWSVAEVLRAWLATACENEQSAPTPS
ncbi:MAG TPA: amylo-alpha-1,6-glucosidase [Pirellulales bacterium]|nr:amylo-alpha-1,6-glucosidase [Pirellulales bacterium]